MDESDIGANLPEQDVSTLFFFDILIQLIGYIYQYSLVNVRS